MLGIYCVICGRLCTAITLLLSHLLWLQPKKRLYKLWSKVKIVSVVVAQTAISMFPWPGQVFFKLHQNSLNFPVMSKFHDYSRFSRLIYILGLYAVRVLCEKIQYIHICGSLITSQVGMLAQVIFMRTNNSNKILGSLRIRIIDSMDVMLYYRGCFPNHEISQWPCPSLQRQSISLPRREQAIYSSFQNQFANSQLRAVQ